MVGEHTFAFEYIPKMSPCEIKRSELVSGLQLIVGGTRALTEVYDCLGLVKVPLRLGNVRLDACDRFH